MKTKFTLSLLLVLLFAADFALVPSAAWQYGIQMMPTTTYYDGTLMTTKGLDWSSAPSQYISFWESSNSTANGFVQNGIAYNGGTNTVCTGNGTVCLGSGKWALFFEYCFNCNPTTGTYYGNFVTPPSGWKATDTVYYSIAVYTTKGEYSFEFNDVTQSSTIYEKACWTPLLGEFGGNVGGIDESGSSSGYGNIYLNHMTLYAQASFNNAKNYGDGYTFYSGTSPSGDITYLYAANDGLIGFNSAIGGSHYTQNNQVLWYGSGTSSLQNFPKDQC
ncbi:MAG: hypothetical protein ACYC7D_01500 [Nitrososphaerales archaeon]